MFFLTTVTEWKGVGRDKHVIDKHNGTQYVFDINNVSDLKPYGAGSRFWYLVSSADRKTGYEEIYCTTPYIEVREEYNIDPVSNVMELSVYPDNNLSKTPQTKYIGVHDFCYAWAYNPNPQYSWFVYSLKGFTNKRILVDMTLSEIIALDYQFNEFNTQWWHYVDPLEIIMPNWFIRV